jgi:hypothetical protein
MEIVTSWMEEGLEKGREEGQQQEAKSLVLRMLRKRLGGLDEATAARIEAFSTERLEELGSDAWTRRSSLLGPLGEIQFLTQDG